jgi:hypothetical protein
MTNDDADGKHFIAAAQNSRNQKNISLSRWRARNFSVRDR